jgi:hypothetical protein
MRLTQLNPSWAYNWGANKPDLPGDIEYVP